MRRENSRCAARPAFQRLLEAKIGAKKEGYVRYIPECKIQS